MPSIARDLTQEARTESGEPSSMLSVPPSKVATTSLIPMGTSRMPSGSLEIRRTASAGRGVFAAAPLRAGTLVEISHVLLFEAQEYEEHGKHTLLDEYTYIWRKSTSEGNTMALALGIGSLFNHSATSPNVSYSLDKIAETIRYTLVRNVDAGEELCISYGSGRMWWELTEPRQGSQRPASELEVAEDDETPLWHLAGLEAEESQREYSESDDQGLEAPRSSSREIKNGAEGEMKEKGSCTSPETEQRYQKGTMKLNGHSSTMKKTLIKPPDPVGPDAAPLWRITAAIDPNTMPLELMDVWILRIAPRKSEAFLEIVRQRKRNLLAAAEGESRESTDLTNDQMADDEIEDEEGNKKPRGRRRQGIEEDLYGALRHLRTFNRVTNSQTGKVELCALVGQVEDWSYEEIMDVFGESHLGDDDDAEDDINRHRQNIDPYIEQVPRYPAPSRERLEEWKAHWPVSVKLGIARPTEQPTDAPALDPTSTSGMTPTVMGPEPNMVVNRATDARSWTPEATEWARRNFVRCIENAQRAKASGELAIGAHVCPAYSPSSGLKEVPDAIVVDDHDTRVSLRNPLKHAVKNAITSVASIRIARDADRLPTVNAKVALLQRSAADAEQRPSSSSSSTSSSASTSASSCHPSFQGLTGSTPRTSSPAPPSRSSSVVTPSPSSSAAQAGAGETLKQEKERLANGQEYLLNNLALFTTHEPCLMCCMALVHSRVKAVYFLVSSPRAGGCCGAHLPEGKRCLHAEDGGPYAVQEQAGLNHHFDVWKWVGQDEALGDGWRSTLDINGLDP